jgi:hypothetical protein
MQGEGGLLDHGPGDVHEAREQVEVLQVTQESYRAAPRLRQPLRPSYRAHSRELWRIGPIWTERLRGPTCMKRPLPFLR